MACLFLIPIPFFFFSFLGFEGDVFYSVAKFNQKNRENLTADMKDLMAESTNALVVDVSTVVPVQPPSPAQHSTDRVKRTGTTLL